MRFVLLVMLLSGLFFFRTFTPVFFWSKGKIEELSYFKMKSKLHIQLYTLPSTPFFGYSKYSFRFGKRNSQPSGLRGGWVSKFRVLNKRMNFFETRLLYHMISNWHISFGVFFKTKKKIFWFESLFWAAGCMWWTREISGRFYSEILFFLSFYDFAGSYCSEI